MVSLPAWASIRHSGCEGGNIRIDTRWATPGEELVVNLKAAKAIGLTIPDSFVLLADDRMYESGHSRLERAPGTSA